MQTKQTIAQLLASAGVAPNKRLGQHFLIDLNLMHFIVDAAAITNDDIVLEVGSGTGSLTEALVETAGFVISVEVDKTLSGILQQRLGDVQNLQLINEDILCTKHRISETVLNAIEQARSRCSGKFLLVANLPYHVASPLMINLAGHAPMVDRMIVTVQKEVALRMTAGVGDVLYGSLGILLSAVGDLKLLKTLSRSVFWPQPEVSSAIVQFVRNEEKAKEVPDFQLLEEVVRLFLSHRRKTVRSCKKFAAGRLAAISDWLMLFEKCEIDPTLRPEQLSYEHFVQLAKHCSEIC